MTQKTFTANIPCSIGDTVFAIRNQSGVNVIRSGRVSEMFFVGTEMRLCIVVYNLCRGEWGKQVFDSYEAARKYLEAKDGL